jgi:DNA-binding LacI/PurR family transcriptional regulator
MPAFYNGVARQLSPPATKVLQPVSHLLGVAAQLLLAGDDDRRHGLFHTDNPYGADVVD